MNPVILTADDPEPPVGSVMLGEGGAWQRASDGWYATGLIDSQEWYELFEYEPTLTLVYRGPDPAPPTYRMAEPQNVGAVVVSKGFRLVRIWEVGHNWADLRTGKQYRWVNITDPQPYQNCVLTADDPEPPLGSVVLDVPAGSVVPNDKGIVWRRDESGWRTAELSQSYTWAWVTYSAHPVTLLYRGEA